MVIQGQFLRNQIRMAQILPLGLKQGWGIFFLLRAIWIFIALAWVTQLESGRARCGVTVNLDLKSMFLAPQSLWISIDILHVEKAVSYRWYSIILFLSENKDESNHKRRPRWGWVDRRVNVGLTFLECLYYHQLLFFHQTPHLLC